MKIDKKNENSFGPKSLLLKKYRGNKFDGVAESFIHLNSPLVQGLISYELSRRGWGPKLFGLFDDGRVEEFLDCHTLTAEEAFTPEIIEDSARAYARFHSLQFPFKNNSNDILAWMLAPLDKSKKELNNYLESTFIENEKLKGNFEKLLQFPFEDEYEWIKSTRDRMKERKVFCSKDMNYLNRLVKNKHSSEEGKRVVIIDFDYSEYYYRGFDLGGHFVNRIFNWVGKDGKLSNFSYPSLTERETFLSFYLDELKIHIDDFDSESLDTLANLMVETDLNALVYLMVLLVFGLTVHTLLEHDPLIWTFIEPSLVLYQALKKEFHLKE